MSKAKSSYAVVTYCLILANLVVFLLEFLSGADVMHPLTAYEWGASFAPVTLGTEWWRLITSLFVHFGVFHLLMNMFALYQMGRSIEKNIGAGAFFLLYSIVGIAAGLVSLYWNLFVFSAGASGAIFGLFGFDIVCEISESRKDGNRVFFILLNFFIYLSLILFLGTIFPFDNPAHVGGLLAGISLGIIYIFFSSRRAWLPLMVSAGGLIILLFVVYWQLPRYQKTYFEIGQKMLMTEKRTHQIESGDYSSDELYLSDMKSITPAWDSILGSLDSLQNIPAPLADDKLKLYKYCAARNLETQYLITFVEKESYIYFDSLDIVRSQMLKMDTPRYLISLQRATDIDSVQEKESKPLGAVVKEYYDSSWRRTEAWDARYYRLGYQDTLGRWDGPARDYYLNTNLQMRGAYKKDLRDGVFIYYTEHNRYDAAGVYRNDRKVGKWEYFHENGRLSQEVRYRDNSYMVNAWSADGIQQVKQGNGAIKEYHANGVLSKYENYKEGLQDSLSYGYHKNGEPYYKEWYEKGELIRGISYSLDNQTFSYDISTFIPQPEGGMNAFRKYEEQEKKKRATLLSGQSGNVELAFSLTNDGEIFDPKVLSGINPQIDKIAKQILLNGPKWIPGKLHGQEPIAIEGYVIISFP